MRDFANQGVDVVRVESGALPGPGDVLVDVQDANVGVYDGRAGEALVAMSMVGLANAITTNVLEHARDRQPPLRRAARLLRPGDALRYS